MKKIHATGRSMPAIIIREWPYLWGGIAFALINTAIFLVNGLPWGITTTITNLSAYLLKSIGFAPEKWAYFLKSVSYERLLQGWSSDCNLLILAGFIIGVVLSSLISGEFSWKKIRTKKQVVLALAGGFLIGYGSRLAFGCNVSAFLGGLSSLSLQGWVFAIASFVGIMLGIKILLKYL